MTRVLLDEPTLAKLKQAGDRAELCDDSGKVVGYFTAVSVEDEYEHFVPEMSEEEYQRLLREPRFSTAQVLEHLRKIGTRECSQ